MSEEGMLAPVDEIVATEGEPLSESAEKEIRGRLMGSSCVVLRDSDRRAYAVVIAPGRFDLLKAAAEYSWEPDLEGGEEVSLQDLQKILGEE